MLLTRVHPLRYLLLVSAHMDYTVLWITEEKKNKSRNLAASLSLALQRETHSLQQM